MDAHDLLRHLKKAKAPHRNLDINIGLQIGFERKTEIKEGSGEVPYFVDPSGQPTKIPDFTRSLDAAYELTEALVPGSVGAVSWEGDAYKAHILGSTVCEASDPALALCVAAFCAHLGVTTDSDQ